LLECRGFGGGVSVILPSGGTSESQYPRGSPGRLFLRGCLSVAALGFPVPVFVVVLRNRRYFSGRSLSAESQYPRGSPGRLFLRGCLSVSALGFPVPVFVVALRNRRCYCRSVIVGGDSQAGRLRRAFLSVAASRFAV